VPRTFRTDGKRGVGNPPAYSGNYHNEKGQPTYPDDPNRLIWYGMCTYWTDDWDHVAGGSGVIPHCPSCGSPGFQTTAHDWWHGAVRFEAEGRKGFSEGPHPGYVEFLGSVREVCTGRDGKSMIEIYRAAAGAGDTP
jgi:hypothetical protein